MTREEYLVKRKALESEAQDLINGGKLDEAKAKMAEITALDASFEASAKAQANLNALTNSVNSVNPLGNTAVAGQTAGTESKVYASRAEMLNSIEYRTAFMNSVLTGTPIPEKFKDTAAQTTASEVGGVIPSTLIQQIVGKLENVGKFWNMVTKTSYKGGVAIPVSSINLSAEWVSERAQSDTQEAPVGSITFSYHKLTCRVAVSFEVDAVTLDIFEAYFVQKISEATVKKLEQGIFTGTGAGQMKGFLTETPATGQKVEITEGSHITYANLVAAEGALPEAYENGAVWVMPKKTYFNEVVGLVDNDGQPIARTSLGIDGKPEYQILGRKVEFSPYMAAYPTTVTADTVVAAIYNFSSYVANTNYNMTIKKYIDEETDDRITKALMLVDGKAVDINSYVPVIVKNS